MTKMIYILIFSVLSVDSCFPRLTWALSDMKDSLVRDIAKK